MVLRMPFSGPSGPVPGMGSPAGNSMVSPPPSPLPSPSQPDLMSLLDQLLQGPAQAKYPPGYKRPKKPTRGEILDRAEQNKQVLQPYLDQMADTYRRVRYQAQGYLTEMDRLARELGRQTPYISSALLDGWNRMVAYLASRPIAYTVDEYDPDKTADSQKIEDYCYYLRKKHERSWVERGNMALNQSESKDLTLFGVVMARLTVDLTNTHCPIDLALMDPATVFPVWGRAGAIKTLESVYRITRMPAQQVLADYFADDPPQKVQDALAASLHHTGDSAMVEVVEYWDTWWRAVFIQGTDVEIVPITEHKYGCVPFVIQYGPGGEPMHTRNPDESWSQYREDMHGNDAERTHKAVGFLERQKLPHDQREGFGTKVLETVLKGFDPPVIIETTADGADEYNFPEIDRSAGATSYLKAGQERAQAVPTSPPAADSQTLMQILGQDAQTNLLNPGFSNTADKSNISGTARSSMAEEGREQESGWVEALELFRGRCAALSVKLWRNFGHLSRYGSGKKQAFYIPRRNPSEGEPRSYELTPDVVDNVDCEVACTMNGLRLSELIPFGQAAQMFGPDGLGIWDIGLIAQKAGVTDIERIQANNRIYRNVRKAEEHPLFAELLSVPQALKEAINRAGSAEEAEALTEQLAIWMEAVAGPKQAQAQGGGQGTPGTPGAAPPPAGGPPPGVPPIGGIPGGTNTAATQGMLPGPGSGPQGPIDNPSPPPPGSFRIA